MAGEGVPAGATHVCRFCNAYWRLHPESGKYERVEWFNGTGHYCVAADLVPIAEAGPAPTTAVPPAPLGTCDLSDEPHEEGEHAEAYGDEPGDCQPCRNWSEAETPAPTTAAPAEQLSGKVVCAGFYMVMGELEPHYRPCGIVGEHTEHGPTSAEQPGKAADPRPAEDCPACDGDGGRSGLQVGDAIEGEACPSCNGTGADPRPAQPQAPAEPTPEQIAKAGRVLAAVMDAERRGENMDPIIARALAEVAAPLREERDRLLRLMAIAYDAEHKDDCGPSDASPDCAACKAEIAMWAEFRRAVFGSAEPRRRTEGGAVAALGAPEGQPPAPPQELLGKEGAGAAPPRKAPQEGPMAHFAALADQDCEHGMEAIGETCSAESASREEGNEEDYPFQYWCGPCIAKAVGFKPSPVRIQRARVLAESAPSSPEEQLSGKELK